MKDSELLNFFDKHKDGKVLIEHFWNEKEGARCITLSQLFRMFELAHEREKNLPLNSLRQYFPNSVYQK